MSDQDLKVAARYLQINILGYTANCGKDLDMQVCHSPGRNYKLNQKSEYGDLCIYYDGSGQHYQGSTSITTCNDKI